MNLDFFQRLKDKKDDLITQLGGRRYNYPHRIASLGTSGSLALTIDERDFTSIGGSASKWVFSLDFSLATEWTRIYEDKYPWGGSTPPAGTPGQGEFLPAHRPVTAIWDALTAYGPYNDPVTIGSCTRTEYSRDFDSETSEWGPWTEDSSATTDIEFDFVFFLSGGGEPDSGGRGDGSSDEECQIDFSDNYGGTESSVLPNLGGTFGRLPWDDSWASETTTFSDAFSTFISNGNSSNGGGYSGTCSLSVDFT